MYALNLAEDGRILSATYPQYAPADSVVVNTLPDGDISEYRYVDCEYIYDPLPVEELEIAPTTEERIAALEESNAMLLEENALLLECILEMSEIVYA
jgi:hypothetical protein